MAFSAPILPEMQAIVAAIAVSGLPVVAGDLPDGGGWLGAPGASDFQPYVVVHALPGDQVDGTAAEPTVDTTRLWQVKSVAPTPEGAARTGDLAIATLAEHLTITVRSVLRLRPVGGGGVFIDEEPSPPLWVRFDRFSLTTTPD